MKGGESDWMTLTGDMDSLTIFIHKELKLCSNLYINEIMELVVRGKEPLYRIQKRLLDSYHIKMTVRFLNIAIKATKTNL